jgi:hypothetical protein
MLIRIIVISAFVIVLLNLIGVLPDQPHPEWMLQ